MNWPDWWSWEIELKAYLLKRMVDRQFNEVDLSLMHDAASGFCENHEENRFVVETIHIRRH
jgi:hypothetical protein